MNPEEFITGDDIQIPTVLNSKLENELFRKIEMGDSIKMIWFRIYDRNSTYKEEYSSVSVKEFEALGLNRNTITKAKEYLEETGYITVDRYPKGHEYEHKIKKSFTYCDSKTGRCKGIKATAYRANTKDEELVSVKLLVKSSLKLLENRSDNHPCSNFSIDCQNSLIVQENRIQTYIDRNSEELDQPKEIRTRNTVRTINHKLAFSRQGLKSKRLFSTFANAPKDSRKFYHLDGNEMVGLDLQCSQVVILAHLLKDEALLEACFNNSLYQAIMDAIDVDRDAAKKYMFWVLYGPNDLRWSKRTKEDKARAKKVQNLIAKEFPVTSEHMIERKQKEGYKTFSVQMQSVEAEIFVDGIYTNLMNKDVPSLLVHDSIHVPIHWIKVTEEIMKTHLDKALGEDNYKIKHE